MTSAFIFHFNVHLLSSTFWHSLVYLLVFLVLVWHSTSPTNYRFQVNFLKGVGFSSSFQFMYMLVPFVVVCRSCLLALPSDAVRTKINLFHYTFPFSLYWVFEPSHLLTLGSYNTTAWKSVKWKAAMEAISHRMFCTVKAENLWCW